MRASPAAAAIALALVSAATAAAQPTGSMAPPPPPQPDPTPAPAAYYPTTTPMAQPPPEPPRRSWFAVVGLGGMGYAGRAITPYDDGNKGSGGLLEAVAGKWLGNDMAVGGRIEAHSDDTKHYTDSSLTAVVRFPIGASGRFYLEPSLGLAFHKDEMAATTDSGLAVAITGGYQLMRKRFACDLRFGGAHLRIDPDDYTHGLLWFGVAIGFQ